MVFVDSLFRWALKISHGLLNDENGEDRTKGEKESVWILLVPEICDTVNSLRLLVLIHSLLNLHQGDLFINLYFWFALCKSHFTYLKELSFTQIWRLKTKSGD